jgi:hypothetical protein
MSYSFFQFKGCLVYVDSLINVVHSYTSSPKSPPMVIWRSLYCSVADPDSDE